VAEVTAVVVVTAFGQRDRIELARDAGAMAYLVKNHSAIWRLE